MAKQTETIIEHARAGNREPLEQLLVAHCDELRDHLAPRLPARLKSFVCVEDVMQEALTKAYLKIDQLRDGSVGAFCSWLKTTGEMAMLGFLRSENAQKRGGEFRRRQATTDRVRGSLIDLLEKLPDEAITASRAVARHEGVAALQVAIAGLPDDQRQAIRLHLLQGMTLEETATAMERTSSAVRSLIHRGKQNLAEAMGRASVWPSQR